MKQNLPNLLVAIPLTWIGTLFLARPVIGSIGVQALGVEGATTLWQNYWMILTIVALVAWIWVLRNAFELQKEEKVRA